MNGRFMAYFILVSHLAVSGAWGGAVFAGDLQSAYDEGWKRYKHREAQGAASDELIGILKTLKEKYIESGLNLGRVDKTLGQMEMELELAAAGAMLLTETELVPAPEPSVRVLESKELIRPTAVLSDPMPVDPVPASAISVPTEPPPSPSLPPARPSPSETESGDPFERYMQRQRKAAGLAPEPAKPVSVPSSSKTSAASAPVDNSAAQSPLQRKIDLLRSPDENVTVNAARELGNSGDPTAVEPLIDVFRRGSTLTSMSAANALAKIGGPAVKPLIRSLDDPDANVRLGACLALSNLKNPDIAPALEKASKDENGRVRGAASEALRRQSQ